MNSRLWSYKYPASISNEARISDYVKKFADRGRSVYNYFCRSPPNSMSVREYEMHASGKVQRRPLGAASLEFGSLMRRGSSG